MGKIPKTWQTDERQAADKFTKALHTIERYNHECKRVVLSGSNNNRTDGTACRGDIQFPDELNILAECKRRQTAAHQTFMDNAMADAAKHGISPENTVLLFKVKRQSGFTVFITDDLFFRLLALPGAAELLEFKETDAENPSKPNRRRTALGKIRPASSSRTKGGRQKEGRKEETGS